PIVGYCLSEQFSAGIGRRNRDLDRMRINFVGEADGVLYGFVVLTRKTNNEGAVNDNAQVMAVARKCARHVDARALLDVVKDLLVSCFIAHEQQPKAVLL